MKPCDGSFCECSCHYGVTPRDAEEDQQKIHSMTLALAQEVRQLKEAGALVCEAFDQKVFIRDISNDHEPRWALKLVVYLRALARLAPEPPREVDQ